MTEPDQTLTPATADDEAMASAESVQEIYAALAPEVLDQDAERPVDDVGPEAVAGQVVHVLLVAHDGERWLPRTLDAVARLTTPIASVTAIDTGSNDATPRLLADAAVVTRVTTLSRRCGVPAAVAAGAALVPAAAGSAASEWLWLLHDDSAPHPDALEQLLRAAIRHDAAVVGPKVLDWDGRRVLLELGVSITGSGRRYTGLERGELDQGQHDDRTDVLAVGSAGMLVRRDVWDQLEGLDPQIEMFRDDVDFGWRARLAGHRVVVAPRAVVEHAAAASSGRRRLHVSSDRAPLIDRRNAVHVLVANAGRAGVVPVVLRVLVGSLLRALGFVLAKVPGLAWDEVVAVAGALRPHRVRQARRWRNEVGRAGSVRRWRPSLGTQLRQAVDNARGLLAGTGAGQDVPAARRRDARDDLLAPAERPTTASRTRVSGRPGVWLVAVVGVLTIVSARTVLLGGRLSGGALLPAPERGSQWWSAYLASWHPVELGSGLGAPPYLAALSALSLPALGSASAVATVLLLGSVPLATASAWWALRPVAPSLPLRLWAAATYGVVVLGTGTVAAGRLGTGVAAVLVPWLARAVAGALRPGSPWRLSWSAALLLALTAAFAPVVWPITAVAAGIAVVAVARSWSSLGRWAVVVAAPAALLAPWLPALLARPELVVMEPGLTGRGDELSDPALPAWNPALLAPGGPGSLPVGVLVGVPVLALIALVVVRSAAARIGWVVALTGLVAAVATSRVPVSTPVGQGVAAGWPGAAVVVVGLGLLLTVSGVDATRLRRHRVVGPALALVAVATTVVAGALGLVSGTADPLARREPSLLPAYVAEQAEAPEQVRTLVLRAGSGGDDAVIGYSVLRQSAARLGDAEVVDPASSALLDEVVADLISGRGAASTGRLAAFGIRYVYTPAPASPDLVDAVDGQSGLVRASSPDGGAIWQVEGTTARVRLLTDDEPVDAPVGVVVPSGPVQVDAAIDSPGATAVVVAELFDPGWSATLDDEPLQRLEVDGMLAFELPRSSGQLRIVHDDPQRRWLLVGQAVALGAVVLLAIPTVSGRRDTVEGSVL